MALRQAVTRLGGRALQRARSSPAVHTSTRGLTHDEQVQATARLLRVELKKEELYDLIAECKLQAPGTFGRNNAQLLKHLSQQVEPRPHDPLWRSCRRWAFANDCYRYAGAIFIGLTAADATAYLVKEMYPQGENNIALDGGMEKQAYVHESS